MIYGVGINDYEHTIKDGKKNIKSYVVWIDMLRRCYNTKNKNYSQYGGKKVKVCDEWLSFSNFKKWFDENYRFDLEKQGFRIELDKDLLGKNSKVYSPETCIFLPHNVNSHLISTNNRNKSKFPGCCWIKERKKWRCQATEFGSGKLIFLGYYSDVEVCYSKFLEFKKKQIESIKKYLISLGYKKEIVNKI